ncbi:MAG: hypothetical protein MI975_05280 [Cytophagales bacterium]|nr:hypothetical protein [Cytophagales bacterium]
MGTTTLEKITTQYRSFVPDQVLTAKQLNTVIDYFETQNRLTRICLSGVGIVCGFELDYTPGSSISISNGCGITTDGDLIKYTAPDKPYDHYRIFEEKFVQYPKFANIDQEEILELMISDESGGSEINPLNTLSGLSDKAVVLYLENYSKEETLCSATDCDTQGKLQVFKIRFLLFNKTDVANLINASDSMYSKHNVYDVLSGLAKTTVKRVRLKGGAIPDNNIATYSKLADTFKLAILDAKNGLFNAYDLLLSEFSNILDIDDNTRNAFLNRLNDLDNFTNTEPVQYRYDLARDLSDTFNEIVDVLLKLKTECCPDIDAFPKHLLLGCLSPTKPYPEFRHEFYHAPVNNEFSTYLKIAKSLFGRSFKLLENFKPDVIDNIAITPSKSCAPVGKKAIPAYYAVDDSLLKVWDFDKTSNYREKYNISYHRDRLAAEDWVRNPLEYDLSCADFYRIEGHTGFHGLESKDEIMNIRAENGLDFDVVMFDMNTDVELFTSFVRKNPSASHGAGVSNGGTFVLLAEKDKTVADFYLSYKLPPETDKQECCSLMECSYPWISSLKYLNNLARSLKGTQSRNRPMPQYYRLDIIEYTINGTRLIGNTTAISVPLEEIFLRRMHAITNALNKRFDKGVVFDFNESQKRLVITKAKEDRFVIRLRDNTLSNNNPVYTYSHNGMFRNNKVFRPDAMRCRDLKSYNPSFYEKLQEAIAPVHKDDDYGTFDEKWRKWTTLRDRLQNHSIYTQADTPRFITHSSELPSKIKEIISAIRTDLKDAGLSTGLSLDGAWVNGTWVDDSMLDYYRQNKKDKHDDIVLFIELRKYLHEKTGVSKLSLYITDEDYSANYDPIIEKHKASADFYFGKPSGENAIVIDD